MARPKSEDKKQALLEAATVAFAQSGIAASTSAIARSAGVAEGTLFRYFATKDELLNELYLAIKLRLVRTMIAGLDPDEKRPKENARNIWNSYIDWGVRNPMEHKAIRRMALSERITDETRRQVKESFPELNEMCQLSVKEIFLSEAYRAFGDALFLSLAETTIEFASHDPQRAREIIALGVAYFISALYAPRLIARYSMGRILLTGLAVQIAGLLLLCATFSRFGVATSALTLVPATALIGYGQALIVNSFYRIGMRDISASDAGAGSAILSTLQQATLGLGPAILGSLFLALARRGGGNYPQALIDFLLVEVAMMLLLGAIALWLRHHLNRQPATVAS
ncbi:TPA: TetR family transcriptional regulator [Klebsiella pneumoniae]|nr:TetR family transcriptional regulator [Klebsiella pneumoniae]HBT9200320.1 TetR family transcriptional regulator [Klebsiella pneumoniae]HBT9317315.1 TetR family transcriptional regulator [Klebsiella pneumoniae]HBT9356674.1 TetR family transcriptional regulator [Klebsiella pneumoniae]HBT9862468.1 TetR family transcriptional regulator [Klebsiella pneumoniae]